MCGRLTFLVTPKKMQEVFDVHRGIEQHERQLKFNWEPRYNIAPTGTLLCIRDTAEGRELFPAQWGLIPSWWKEEKFGGFTLARADTVANKPAFRTAFKNKRCLIIASGFFEWYELDPKIKVPHYITLKSNEPMAFAGLWDERTSPNGETVVSCAICTTDPNSLLSPIGDRMPVILPHAMIEPWLDPKLKDATKLQPILGQYPASEMQEWEVSRDVNSSRNQGEYLTEPIEPTSISPQPTSTRPQQRTLF